MALEVAPTTLVSRHFRIDAYTFFSSRHSRHLRQAIDESVSQAVQDRNDPKIARALEENREEHAN